MKLTQQEIDSSFSDYHQNENPYAHPVQDRMSFDSGYSRGHKAAITALLASGEVVLRKDYDALLEAAEVTQHVADLEFPEFAKAQKDRLIPDSALRVAIANAHAKFTTKPSEA